MSTEAFNLVFIRENDKLRKISKASIAERVETNWMAIMIKI